MPEIFVQKFGDQLSPIVTVNGPNGQVWKLGLENENDTICFSDGWEKFLDHYSISLGHLLIFKYEGNSVFNVLEIFDATACKIGYHYDSLSSDVEPDSVHIEEEQKDFGFNDEISVSTSYSPSQSSSECETSNEYLSQGTLKKRKKYTTWTDRKKKQKHIRKGASNVPTATQSCEKCVHHKESEFAEEEAAAAAKTPKEHRFHSSVKWNPKSKYSKISHCFKRIQAAKIRARKAAEMFQSEYPFFKAVLRRHNIYNSFVVSVCWFLNFI